jgi:3-isopropylmalate/(R)-2-methylmalate dehydratase small subunit
MPNKCWKVGDNISTDEIISTQYMTLTDTEELGKHVFENARPEMAESISGGDILLAGENMGYGSSREHAPLALKGAGIGAVIACSFARLFYRNCINIGMPVIISREAVKATEEGDLLSFDLEEGIITNETRNLAFRFDPFPSFINNYLKKGGLINALNEEREN